MADIEDAISESAQGPKKVSGDQGSVEQHSILDQIEADKYLSKKAAYKRGVGLRIARIISNGI